MHQKPLFPPANDSRRLFILLSVIAVLSGGMIYVLLRPAGHVFFYRFIPVQSVPEWIVFSLPNGLWAFAYALLITGIWSGSKSLLRYFWMATIPLLVLGFEFLQLAGIIPGTFCMQDVALGAAGLILGMIVANKIVKSKNHERTFD
jgi:hypothetical protein